jgi:hypothetical protein
LSKIDTSVAETATHLCRQDLRIPIQIVAIQPPMIDQQRGNGALGHGEVVCGILPRLGRIIASELFLQRRERAQQLRGESPL